MKKLFFEIFYITQPDYMRKVLDYENLLKT